MSGNWNEYNVKPLTRNHWRASLVPAAAVIPAPIAYIKVVAVKRLVVELMASQIWPTTSCGARRRLLVILLENSSALHWVGGAIQILYCEKNKVFKAGFKLVCVSME
jgi:hypothetical protein